MRFQTWWPQRETDPGPGQGRSPRLFVGRDEIWLILPGDQNEARSSEEPDPQPGGLCVCQAILPGGRLLLGRTDPEREAFLAALLRKGRCVDV